MLKSLQRVALLCGDTPTSKACRSGLHRQHSVLHQQQLQQCSAHHLHYNRRVSRCTMDKPNKKSREWTVAYAVPPTPEAGFDVIDRVFPELYTLALLTASGQMAPYGASDDSTPLGRYWPSLCVSSGPPSDTVAAVLKPPSLAVPPTPMNIYFRQYPW